MSTKQQPKNAKKDKTGENDIKHTYFDRIPIKEWKAVGALAYYIEQGVSMQEACIMIELALAEAMKSRKGSKDRAQAIAEETKVLKVVSEGGLASGSSASASSSTVKVADNINNFGNISQTNNNISQQRKRKSVNKAGKL